MIEPSVVWIDGALVDPSAGSIRWDDRGLTHGLGAFETIELRHGAPFALDRHLRRLTGGLASLGIASPEADLRAVALLVAERWGAVPGRLRITVTAGPPAAHPDAATVMVTAGPGTVREGATKVIVSSSTRNERSALVGVKSTSYAESLLVLSEAQRCGATEALLFNTRGSLCEGATSNVVVEIDGELVTPPLSSGCLPGITRELLLELSARSGPRVSERDLTIDDVTGADSIYLLSTGRHLQPVSHLDGVEMPRCPGELGAAAAHQWALQIGSLTGEAAVTV